MLTISYCPLNMKCFAANATGHNADQLTKALVIGIILVSLAVSISLLIKG